MRSYGQEPQANCTMIQVKAVPCVCANGDYQIVQDLAINAFSRERMNATDAELREERSAVESLL